ncbi:MAG TPA: YlxR family protein [Aldersonia sp.]
MRRIEPDSGTVVDGRRAASAAEHARTPVRTCVGCREREPATELLRIVARVDQPPGARLVPDPQRRLPGRGAWLHPDPSCLSIAERRRAFGRALRVSGQPDTSDLQRFIETGTTLRQARSRDRHEHS